MVAKFLPRRVRVGGGDAAASSGSSSGEGGGSGGGGGGGANSPHSALAGRACVLDASVSASATTSSSSSASGGGGGGGGADVKNPPLGCCTKASIGTSLTSRVTPPISFLSPSPSSTPVTSSKFPPSKTSPVSSLSPVGCLSTGLAILPCLKRGLVFVNTSSSSSSPISPQASRDPGLPTSSPRLFFEEASPPTSFFSPFPLIYRK